MSLGVNVRRLRTELDWSQERLAREMEMSRETIRRIEAGDEGVQFGTIRRLAEIFGVSIGALVGEVVLPKAKPAPSASRARFQQPSKPRRESGKTSRSSASNRCLTHTGSQQPKRSAA